MASGNGRIKDRVKPMRLVFRGYANGSLQFTEPATVGNVTELHELGMKHADQLVPTAIGPFMLEIEFLDVKDPNERFKRFGYMKDKNGGVIPIPWKG